MATRTWTISYDSSTRGSDVDYGNTDDQHHPIGRHQSVATVYRMFAKFNVDKSGMASISQAVLHLKSTGQTHIAFGSSPTLRVKRLTSTLSNTAGGSGEGSWSSSARPTRSTEPSSTTSGQSAATNMTRSEGTWDTIDITSIAQAWLTNTNYGIVVIADDEGSNADAWECYSQNSSYDPYITVTYTATVTNTAPTATPSAPLTGDVAALAYTAGSGWASPRPTVSWAFTDPESDGQSAYQVIVYNDTAGSPGTTLYDSGKVSSSATSLQIPATFAESSYYHWKVQVWDAHDLVSAAYTATQRFRVRWGAAEYVYDTGSVPTAWGAVTVTSAGTVVIEYNSTTATGDPGAGLGSWMASLASVALQRYVRYRVWLLPGSVAPVLSDITIAYTAASLPTADNWTVAGSAVVDTATQMYGTRCMLFRDGSAYQTVDVKPNTQYMLSAWINQAYVDDAFLYVADAVTGAPLASITDLDNTNAWVRLYTSWNSGSSQRVRVYVGGSISDAAWVDAAKLEESTALTPWKPSTTSGAVTLDASGIRVDGSEGGTLRLRGSSGGARDIVELGTKGILLGGDAHVYSDVANVVVTDDEFNAPAFTVYDATLTRKPFAPLGVGMRYAVGGVLVGDTFGTTISLAANGGSVMCWLEVVTPIRLQSWLIRNTDTATARSYEIALFKDTASGGSNTLTKVAESYSSESFTPSAASTRSVAVATPNTVLPPGMYVVVLRNSHATSTFTVAAKAAGTLNINNARTKTLATALSATSTLDMATSWSSTTSTPAIVVEARNLGATYPM